MAILTSKEYVDAHGGGGGVIQSFKASASGTAQNVDISTASTTAVQATLGTFGNYAAIDSAKTYLVSREFFCRVSGKATAESDITITVQMLIGSMSIIPAVDTIATRIPATTNAEFMKVVGGDVMLMTGAEIKSQVVKATIETTTNVAGATVDVSGGVTLRFFEVNETDLNT